MKKYEGIKTIQLAIYILLAAAGIFLIITDKELYHIIATNSHVRLLCILLWLGYAFSFLFIFFDFTERATQKKDFNELDLAISQDPVAGIANRFSVDMLIEKYLDKPVPDSIGVIMLDLANLQEINSEAGHLAGNEAIRDFSDILHDASFDLCFVGRNGGNKFLALFEEASPSRMKEFMARVEKQITQHNELLGNINMHYNHGSAYQAEDMAESINALIALANKRAAKDKKKKEKKKKKEAKLLAED